MERKKSPRSLLNPLEWFAGFFRVLAVVFGPLLRCLGVPPSTEGFANVQRAEVADAAKLAAEQEAAVDELHRQMSPAEIVRAYAKADVAGRATMDLSVLDFAEQDWLLGLSDEDLSKLAMSTTNGCARSLEKMAVLPSYPKLQQEMETAEIYAILTVEDVEAKREFISAQFRELFLAPGIPNPNPKFASTLH